MKQIRTNEFGGRNILYEVTHEPATAESKESISVLLAARDKRPRPHLDNKILTSWNALQISAFSKGYVVLGDKRYLEAAERAANFLLNRMYDKASGQLLRRYCDGEAAVSAFLDDYAFLAQALLDLFEATSDVAYLETALDLANRGLTRFEDQEASGFFSTEEGVGDVLLRIKDDYDGAEPSGNSVATDVLIRLMHITGNEKFRERATKSLQAFAPKLKAQPTMAPQMMVALARWLSEPEQTIVRCAVLDEECRKIVADCARKLRPANLVLALSDGAAETLIETAPFLASLERKGRLTIYKCRNFTCELPQVIG